MSKSAEAFRTISEVAEVLETPAHVLRFWESRFSQIKPVKRAGGRRYYRPADVALLGGIRRLLHDDGLTIRGVQKILREKGVRHVAALSGAEVGWTVEDVDAEVSPGTAGHGPDADPVHAVAMPVDPPVAAATGDLFANMLPAGAVPDSERTDRDDRHAEAPMEVDAPTLPRPGATEATPFPSSSAHDSGMAAPARPAAPATAQVPDDMPAAALLRAMDAARARSVRTELRQIHDRLSALRERLGPRD
jgi:DNA-binding transcriptional MerR regulator